MTTIDDWPPIGFHRAVVTTHPRWSGRREVTPTFDRTPDADWCHLFREACQAAPDLTYPGGGQIVCGPDEVDVVELRLVDLTAQANAGFSDFLRKASETQPDEVAELISLEGSSAATGDVGDGWRCAT